MNSDIGYPRPLIFDGWYGYFLPDVDTTFIGEFQAFGGAVLKHLPHEGGENVLCFGSKYPSDFPETWLLFLPSFISHCARVGFVGDQDRFLASFPPRLLPTNEQDKLMYNPVEYR
ncbi:hypothetical protein RCL1_008464 [Eukaryota sp. TZLM3-RCL]